MIDYQARADKILEDSRKDLDRSRENWDKQEKKMKEAIERVEELSMKNFASWRDYLHRYFSIIFILIGATGFLQNESFTSTNFRIGLYLSLVGTFIGYIIINIYFYIERRWLQGQDLLSIDGIYKQFDHPDKQTDGFAEGLELHNRDYVKRLEKRLLEAKGEKNKKQIRYLKMMIKASKKIRITFKFIGQHFGLIEKIWVGGIALSVLLTFIGVTLMYTNITNNLDKKNFTFNQNPQACFIPQTTTTSTK